jgi:hypothetical protein
LVRVNTYTRYDIGRVIRYVGAVCESSVCTAASGSIHLEVEKPFPQHCPRASFLLHGDTLTPLRSRALLFILRGASCWCSFCHCYLLRASSQPQSCPDLSTQIGYQSACALKNCQECMETRAHWQAATLTGHSSRTIPSWAQK